MSVDLFDLSTHDFTKSSAVLFRNASEFSEYIEMYAAKSQRALTSTLIEYCELSDLDYTELSVMLTETLKQKIAEELREEGLLPKINQLSFEE